MNAFCRWFHAGKMIENCARFASPCTQCFLFVIKRRYMAADASIYSGEPESLAFVIALSEKAPNQQLTTFFSLLTFSLLQTVKNWPPLLMGEYWDFKLEIQYNFRQFPLKKIHVSFAGSPDECITVQSCGRLQHNSLIQELQPRTHVLNQSIDQRISQLFSNSKFHFS